MHFSDASIIHDICEAPGYFLLHTEYAVTTYHTTVYQMQHYLCNSHTFNRHTLKGIHVYDMNFQSHLC